MANFKLHLKLPSGQERLAKLITIEPTCELHLCEIFQIWQKKDNHCHKLQFMFLTFIYIPYLWTNQMPFVWFQTSSLQNHHLLTFFQHIY